MKANITHTKRIRITASCTAFAAGVFCLTVLPLSGGNLKKMLVQYYRIVADGKEYGYYKDEKEAAEVLLKARQELAKKQGGIALSDAVCGIRKVYVAEKRVDNKQSEQQIGQIIEEHLQQNFEEAYTIKVNDFAVTVASREAVLATLETVKNHYGASECYTINLQNQGEGETLVPCFTAPEGVDTGGIQEMGFDQSVEIGQAYVAEEEITAPEEAAASLTREWDTPGIYVVEKGDCLSIIAEKNGMRTQELVDLNQLSDADYIDVGDELVITIPQPELSIWYRTQAVYEEAYEPEVEYRDNDSWYAGTEKVIQEGTQGRRQVVASITYSQGRETGREILQETLLEEAQPRIIERGTIEPPTYIKPLVGGSFSSPFGSRWGRMHKGIDWSCSVGTAVRASCGGRVVSAGWVNGYGKCITISHSDGKQTRYAHLSQILVSSGENVKQGEKIALSGNTGNSTGPHLHFEILVNGVQVNPSQYLK